MNIIGINQMKPQGGEVAIFQGSEHNAQVSFFVVQFSPGEGPRKHRHPYEETFILLNGEIELNVGGETQTIGSGKIAIVPAHTSHAFKNCSDEPLLMVNIHPVPKMITDWL